MENQVSDLSSQTEFVPGSSVVYGLHGKCKIVSIDARSVEGKSIRFYRLQLQKSPLSRSNRNDPAIWVPTENAKTLGLRPPMEKLDAEECMKMLTNREVLLDLTEAWPVVMPKLEAIVRNDGPVGLTKVYSYLYLLKQRYAVSPGDLNKFHDLIHKLLFRELSDALGQPANIIEKNALKGLKNKH
jgi:RNA polymerase-interacting CarD/CdnL/TRCF family regulator